jgi:predicted nucleic acid-binding protein
MRTAVDTNVVSAVWSREPLATRAAARLGAAHQEGGLVISAVVYAELLAHPNATPAFVDGFLTATNIVIDFSLDESVWRDIGRRFAAYAERRRRRRSSGGTPKRLLVDFLIGAHALLRADRLLTLDGGRYSQDFPNLVLLAV